MRLHAGLESLVPPQSAIAAGSAAGILASLPLRSKRLLMLSVGTMIGQLTFVLAGLRLVRAPARVYRALATAPALVANKLGLYARIAGGGGPKSWVRTERESAAPQPAER